MRVGLLLVSPLLAALLSLAAPESSAAADQIVHEFDRSDQWPPLPGYQLVAASPTEAPESSDEPELLRTPGAPEPTGEPVQPTSPPETGPETPAETEAEVRSTTTDPTPPPPPADRSESGLPITGAQVGGMVLLGTGMVAGGVAMLAVRRRRSPADLLNPS